MFVIKHSIFLIVANSNHFPVWSIHIEKSIICNIVVQHVIHAVPGQGVCVWGGGRGTAYDHLTACLLQTSGEQLVIMASLQLLLQFSIWTNSFCLHTMLQPTQPLPPSPPTSHSRDKKHIMHVKLPTPICQKASKCKWLCMMHCTLYMSNISSQAWRGEEWACQSK